LSDIPALREFGLLAAVGISASFFIMMTFVPAVRLLLDRRADTGEATSGSSVSIFVDLGEANGTGGERGAAIEYGPRVGPAALEELLCSGRVQIIGLTHGRPVVTSTATRAIPPG